MKNMKLSVLIFITASNILYAGGDFTVITPYETEDVIMAEEAYVEPIIEPVIEPMPEPIVVVPVPVPVEDINPSGFYAGLGIAAARYQSNCTTTPTGCGPGGVDKTAGVMARVGYDFNQYIGVEARGIRTNWKSNGGKVKHAGVFLKPMLPLGDKTNVYGLVGIAKTTTQGSMQRTDAEATALGLGVEVDLSKDTPKDGRYGRAFDGKGDQEKGLGAFADYERMVVKSGAPDLDAVSVGVTYDF
ncbi:MAG: Unknown protein [uncultured Sulfurovum sp.]|uniref:Outer membrane protein beta-barrel domain-containing protein n=1 Tax=uncultured Sulfurovum sp. TaxID=269237 RepID=A0A6S6SG01_9BACT|nr:MAG: Unknown protein [uncultured Sulfurovum sp.]